MTYIILAPDPDIGRTRWLVRHELGGGAILCNTEAQANVIAWALSQVAAGLSLAAAPLTGESREDLVWYAGPVDGITEPTYYTGLQPGAEPNC